jgi:hypothetical protein
MQLERHGWDIHAVFAVVAYRAAGFLAEVLHARAGFLALLSASGTCARRLGGAPGQVRLIGSAAECREGPQLKTWIHRNGGLPGMAGRRDCLVATPDGGSQQSA